ncbi:MAG: hypothetical protein OES38_00830 [Gammaproteobacteria bacterium]|nr:hypothetical protein [Gammaproteobacteria bacterium]
MSKTILIDVLIKGLMLFLLAGVLSGCDSETVDTFKDLFSMREALQEIAQTDEVHLSIHNNTSLTITLTDSPFNSKEPEVREAIAREVATAAWERYTRHDDLQELTVLFQDSERVSILVERSDFVDSYQYRPEDLAWSPSPPLHAVEIPLSEVSTFSIGDQQPPIAAAYMRYGDTLIAVEGIRLGPGLPAGLGSHQFVGLHEPPDPGQEFRVLVSGNVPPEHGKRYRVLGRIEPLESNFRISVVDWEALAL